MTKDHSLYDFFLTPRSLSAQSTCGRFSLVLLLFKCYAIFSFAAARCAIPHSRKLWETHYLYLALWMSLGLVLPWIVFAETGRGRPEPRVWGSNILCTWQTSRFSHFVALSSQLLFSSLGSRSSKVMLLKNSYLTVREELSWSCNFTDMKYRKVGSTLVENSGSTLHSSITVDVVCKINKWRDHETGALHVDFGESVRSAYHQFHLVRLRGHRTE